MEGDCENAPGRNLYGCIYNLGLDFCLRRLERVFVAAVVMKGWKITKKDI